MKYFILFILFLSANVSNAQFENTDAGARAAALNGSFTSIADNSIAVFYNPSGLAQLTNREVSFYYSPAPYGLSELSIASFSYAEPTKIGTFGAGVKTYGFDLYREITGLVSYGNSFRNKIYYGINLNFYHLNIKNYNSASSFGVDIGTMAYLTSFLKWGFFGKNLTGSKIGESKERITQVYRTGFTIQPRTDLLFALEMEKDVKYPFSFRAGFEYTIIEYIDIRAGIGSEPTNFSAGVGFSYSLFQIDYAIQNHPDLGFTHQGGLTINFGGLNAKKSARERLREVFGK
ncbi:MAG: hypothetical protein JW917_02120 [Ignavibacteria bacterium]|nr:hypothetical protein [Ignavibacteria bacterium]